MKKIICLISAVMIVLTALPAAVYGEAPDPDNPRTLNFLVLGDSISTGYGLPGDIYARKSYGNLEAEYLNSNGYNVTYANKAVDGYTSSNLLNLLEQDSEVITLVRNADIIVYSIGGNDFLGSAIASIAKSVGAETNLVAAGRSLASKDYGDIEEAAQAYFSDGTVFDSYKARAETYAENGQKIYDRIRELNPEAYIFMQTLYNPMDNFEMFLPFKSFVGDVIEMFNEVTKSFDGDYTVIDVFSAMKDRGTEYTNIMSYDIHPNTDGHGIIFNLLNEAVNGVLAEADAAAAEEEENENENENGDTTSEDSVEESENPANNENSVMIPMMVLVLIAAAVLAAVILKIRPKNRK